MLFTLACRSMNRNAAYFAGATTDRKFPTNNNIYKEEFWYHGSLWKVITAPRGHTFLLLILNIDLFSFLGELEFWW